MLAIVIILLLLSLGHTICQGPEAGQTNTGEISEEVIFEPYLEHSYIVVI